jgi:dissimilatory sulfite reductase (desulfoviridin) alpha/beta subunit
MKWEKKAEEAVRRVPFFVRGRVRKRVEEEARRRGSRTVTEAHVRTCQERFLTRMEEEVKGYQVETCFGPTGCPNRAFASDSFAARAETLLGGRELRAFLEEKVTGKLKLHHEFRLSCSDCPNACSRPQIADIGLIGACRPAVTEKECTECEECVEACREAAIELVEGRPVIDFGKCLDCGKCIDVCPTGTLEAGEKGFRVLVGGKLGRHPRLGYELPGIYGEEESLALIGRCLDHYQRHCRKGERFGEILERTGTDAISQEEEADGGSPGS